MKYGLYLYGSEYRKQALPTSDIDLMLVTADFENFQNLRSQVADELLLQKPEWRNRKLDFRFIGQRTDRSPKAVEVFGLAELWQLPRSPILGEDLVPLCYRPTREDFELAVIGQIHHMRQKYLQPSTADILMLFKKAGTVKPIYTLQFYLSLWSLLRSRPGEFFFSSTDLKDPAFLHTKTFLRETLFYKYPEKPEQIEEVRLLLTGIKEKMAK